MKRRKQIECMAAHVVVFVEGDTDEVFFNRLMSYYRQASTTPIHSYEIQNLKGVSRYASSKIMGKLDAEVIPRNVRKGKKVYGVCCSYDTDVFENEETPIVDWKKLRKSILRLGIEEFCTVEVKSAIEDWLLDDLEGLCAFLKLKETPRSIKGASGYSKLSYLFKRCGKIYAKGVSVEDFIDILSMEVIRNKRKDALAELERILNVTVPDM